MNPYTLRASTDEVHAHYNLQLRHMERQSRRDTLVSLRLTRLRRALPGVTAHKPAAVHAARTSIRRLREILPLLGIAGPPARKLARRLRKARRLLGPVRDFDTQLELLERVARIDPSGSRLLRQLRTAIGEDADRQWNSLPAARIVKRLDRIATQLSSAMAETTPSAQADRALRWAAQARLARRSAQLRTALRAAGAIYEAEHLHDVRIALKKLRYSAELAADAGAALLPDDLARLNRLQAVLGRQRDAQVLVDRVRESWNAVDDGSLATWREVERLTALLDTRCHRLHARFMRERTVLLATCDRIGGVAGSAAPRRKAG
jgi:CHAD domain-containing protein